MSVLLKNHPRGQEEKNYLLIPKNIFVQLGFSARNGQKVQFNTDLLKHRTRYLYANEKGWLKINEMKRVWLKAVQIKLGIKIYLLIPKNIFVQLGFSARNGQKVQFNTDLLKHRTRHLYANEKGWLKINEMKRVGLKANRIKLGRI